MTSLTTAESLYARYSKPLADVLGEVDDFDPVTLTPDTFTEYLGTASICLNHFGGSLADVADDLDAALIYLDDAEQASDSAIRASLMGMASKRLEALFFASDELVW